jgi:tetratricopeptide (TPR) repeat protein
MTTHRCILGLFLVAFSTSAAQNIVVTAPEPSEERLLTAALAPEDNQGDPGYGLYKAGYGLVLEERWKEAREKFSELLARFPKSDYIDDASYWSAFCLKHTSKKEALAAYKKFLEAFRSSSYYDDAVADKQDLEFEQNAPRSLGVPVAPPAAVGVTPRPDLAPSMKHWNRQLSTTLRRMLRPGRIYAPTPGSSYAIAGTHVAGEEPLDEKTQLKIEALNALGGKEDDESFATLREVALNTHQHRAVREVAIDGLSTMSKHDVLPVLVEIAGKDTVSDLASQSIDLIGQLDIDKNRRVTTLEEVFRSLPARRSEERQTVVYTIANVGNDRAVDFLKSVALSDGDMDLRKDAVYFLGNIGSPHSRQALQDILRNQ